MRAGAALLCTESEAPALLARFRERVLRLLPLLPAAARSRACCCLGPLCNASCCPREEPGAGLFERCCLLVAGASLALLDQCALLALTFLLAVFVSNAARTRFDWLDLAATIVTGSALGAIPPYIKTCKRHEPQLNDCITDSIEQLRAKLSQGIPELDAPAIEPLYLDQIRLLRGPHGARLDINVTGLKVYGPSTFKIRDLKADTENVKFTFKVSFDKLTFRGKYSIDARLLLLRLTGSGDLTGNFTGYESDVILTASKVFRNNDTYLNFEKMKLDITIGGANLYLSNLFGGDPILGPASNEILNANSGVFLDELRPVLEQSLSDLFTNVANKITRSFTYNELFPID